MTMAKRHHRRNIMAASALAVLAAAFAAAAALVLGQPDIGGDFCRKDGDYPRTAVLVDATDTLSESQVKLVLEEIGSLRGRIEKGEWMGVYVLNEDNLTLPATEIALCNPGSRETANALYENPEQMERDFQRKFLHRVEDEIRRLASAPPQDTSPIFEMIHAVARDGNFDSTKKRRLIIVSDMLQNMPEFSHYRDGADFEQWRGTDYARNFRQMSLLDADVEILYLIRVGGKSEDLQTRGHVEFWEDYFRDIGASVKVLKPIR